MDIESCLQCAICHDVYTDPKQLSCGHSFCKSCLDDLRQLYSVSCAICRKPTYLNMTGASGIQNLPTNYALIQIIDAFQSNVHVMEVVEPAKVIVPNIKVEQESPLVFLSNDKSQFKCGNCKQFVPLDSTWVCGDCEECVFCAPCIVAKHRFHRRCIQLSAMSTEWQMACDEYDTMKGNVEKCIAMCDEVVSNYKNTKKLFNRADHDVAELTKTLDELSKMYSKAKSLRLINTNNNEDDIPQIRHLHRFGSLIKQMDFLANRLTMVIPVLDDRLKEVNDCLTKLGNDLAETKWSGLTQKYQSHSRDTANVLFFWDEPTSNCVQLAASFTNWKPSIQMVLRNGEHLATVDLPKGRHEFKFWVDGHWRTSNNWPTCSDASDNTNNYLVV